MVLAVAERTSALHRFFVEPGVFAGDAVQLAGGIAHQLARVLRVRVGERVVLLDGDGPERVVEVTAVSPKLVEGVVRETRASAGEPRLPIALYQGLVLREKLEWIIQKGTEVGISEFIPVACERSNAPRGEGVDERRLERWRRIATEAAAQSGRGAVPAVRPPLPFADAVAEAVGAGPTLVAWEGERARSVREGLRLALGVPVSRLAGEYPLTPTPLPQGERGSARRLSLFVGPEGGFSPREVGLAVERGALTVSLGPRILRTETAGPILAALALYEVGELAPLGHAEHPVSSA